jgi:hypothetical protein
VPRPDDLPAGAGEGEQDSVCSTDRVEKLSLRTDGSRMKMVLKSSIPVVSPSTSSAGTAG